MIWISPIVLSLGLYLPGCLIARCLRHKMWWASGFVISLLLLFHCVFWVGVLKLRITLWTVMPTLAAVAAVAAWFARREAVPAKTMAAARWTVPERALLLTSALVAALLLVRCAIAPLIGFDTLFRWDFLADRILSLGSFNYYPPLVPADYRSYFYPDAIPPLVSFANWFIYASIGGRAPSVLSVFAAAQFVFTLAFTYGAGGAILSRRAGVIAAAVLAASGLFFNSVLIEQETGLTALSMAAMIYFIAVARQPRDVAAMVSAGMAAALCALSREYGCISLIAGVVALAWRRQSRKDVFLFAAVFVAAAAPWYLRTWALSGNPVYPLRLGPFAVNPVYDGILRYYNTVLGGEGWFGGGVGAALSLLLPLAPLQLLVGVPGAFLRFRERGYLGVIALLIVGVWLQSIGYTSAGLESSTRVLSPALVVLSITAAALLDRFAGVAPSQAVALVIVCQIWTVLQGLVYPMKPLDLSVRQWRQTVLVPTRKPPEFQIADRLAQSIPPGTRLLSDNAYLHAALAHSAIDVVPVWSPEVRFLFSAPPEEAERRLASLGIETVVYYPTSLNTGYLSSSSGFYAELPRRWRLVAELPGLLVIFHR